MLLAYLAVVTFSDVFLLRNNDVYWQLSWACEESDGMVTRTILLWHTALPQPFPFASKLDAAMARDEAPPSHQDRSNVDDTPNLLPEHSFRTAYELDTSIEEARTCGRCSRAALLGHKAI
ncbi:hypothetical protein D1007_17567 [Hordeum vulgare]|nr:hypothetical protein D1007_17567 [Hordeum vulgare]